MDLLRRVWSHGIAMKSPYVAKLVVLVPMAFVITAMLIARSPDTSKVGCMKAILGNPAMIQAFRPGIRTTVSPFPTAP